MLERMHKKRLKTYAKLGYEITEASTAQGPGARIITTGVWHAQFSTDLSHACRSVIISAPYANLKLVESLMHGIDEAIARGVEIRIILKKPKGERSLAIQASIAKTLAGAGCKVVVGDSPLGAVQATECHDIPQAVRADSRCEVHFATAR